MTAPSRRRLAALLGVLLAGAAALPAQAASERGVEVRDGRAEHGRIVQFWTPERVAQAVPRDFVLDPSTGRFDLAPAKKPDGTPGGGTPSGDGGDGSTTAVAGASWEGGQGVAETTGKVLFQMGTSYYVCSASVVHEAGSRNADGTDGEGLSGRSLILTAAHCVYDESTNEFAQNWMFIPAYDASPERLTADGTFCSGTLHGCWTAQAIAVHAGYAGEDSFNSRAVLYDFAVVRVGLGGHDEGTELDGLVTSQPTSFAEAADGADTYQFGYPAQKKYDGTDLVYSRGPLGRDPNTGGTTYRVGSELNGGSSGGGWYTPFVAADGTGVQISVNSYGYTGLKAIHGPVFNTHTEAVYDAAAGEPGNVVVTG